jgi:hypothetical protein
MRPQPHRDVLYGNSLSPWRTMVLVTASLAFRGAGKDHDSEDGLPTTAGDPAETEDTGIARAVASVHASLGRINAPGSSLSQDSTVVIMLTHASPGHIGRLEAIIGTVLEAAQRAGAVVGQESGGGHPARGANPVRPCAGEACGDPGCGAASCPWGLGRRQEAPILWHVERAQRLLAEVNYLHSRDRHEAASTALPGARGTCTVVSVVAVNTTKDVCATYTPPPPSLASKTAAVRATLSCSSGPVPPCLF